MTLQTQEATILAASLSMKQAKTRMSRPIAGREEFLPPPPPKSHFLQVVPGYVTSLQAQTTDLRGTVHAFSNSNQLLVRKPGSDQLQVMTPGHHYLMVVQPQYLSRAVQLYQQVKQVQSSTHQQCW